MAATYTSKRAEEIKKLRQEVSFKQAELEQAEKELDEALMLKSPRFKELDIRVYYLRSEQRKLKKKFYEKCAKYSISPELVEIAKNSE